LLERLDAALPLLTGGGSDRPERQRTLRSTIEWSHDLLDHDAQAAFRRLSVFRGSFTLDAAEAIAGAELDQLAALLDQSLLKPLGDDRFYLVEQVRLMDTSFGMPATTRRSLGGYVTGTVRRQSPSSSPRPRRYGPHSPTRRPWATPRHNSGC
jgi:hypothetical protein